MEPTLEELYGKMALSNILSSVWLGDWKRYEDIFSTMREDVQMNFPFHQHYDREQVKQWYENHFFIPGDYFVSPYFSSYSIGESGDEDARKKDLLCLIGMYEKTGFYYPLEKELYPDHMGCLVAFWGSVIQEQIKASQTGDEEYVKKLAELEGEILNQYILPVLNPLRNHADPKISHSFFKEFLDFFALTLDHHIIAV